MIFRGVFVFVLSFFVSMPFALAEEPPIAAPVPVYREHDVAELTRPRFFPEVPEFVGSARGEDEGRPMLLFGPADGDSNDPPIFEGQELAEAVRAIFRHAGLEVPDMIVDRERQVLGLTAASADQERVAALLAKLHDLVPPTVRVRVDVFRGPRAALSGAPAGTLDAEALRGFRERFAAVMEPVWTAEFVTPEDMWGAAWELTERSQVVGAGVDASGVMPVVNPELDIFRHGWMVQGRAWRAGGSMGLDLDVAARFPQGRTEPKARIAGLEIDLPVVARLNVPLWAIVPEGGAAVAVVEGPAGLADADHALVLVASASTDWSRPRSPDLALAGGDSLSIVSPDSLARAGFAPGSEEWRELAERVSEQALEAIELMDTDDGPYFELRASSLLAVGAAAGIDALGRSMEGAQAARPIVLDLAVREGVRVRLPARSGEQVEVAWGADRWYLRSSAAMSGGNATQVRDVRSGRAEPVFLGSEAELRAFPDGDGYVVRAVLRQTSEEDGPEVREFEDWRSVAPGAVRTLTVDGDVRVRGGGAVLAGRVGRTELLVGVE